jgi:hypothetical protein
MSGQINRRVFVKRAAFGAGAWWILHNSRSARSYAANEKLNLAVVGVGSRGSWHASTVRRVGQNLAALCDVDSRRAEPWQKEAPGVPWYQDFRRMLDEQDTRLDGVIAALPAHNHAAVGAAAMRRGKHVYLEKPLAQNVGEARALRHIAAEQRVATQMGNQGMATDSFRRTLELVQDGALGEIREAHVWFVYGGSGPRDLPTGEQPVPDYLNWDVWLGPRPTAPTIRLGCPGAWRDGGTGVLGGCGSHGIHMAFKGLRLGALWGTDGDVAGTIRIEAEPSEISPNTFPRWQIIRYDIPARGDLPPVRIHWYNARRPNSTTGHLAASGSDCRPVDRFGRQLDARVGLAAGRQPWGGAYKRPQLDLRRAARRRFSRRCRTAQAAATRAGTRARMDGGLPRQRDASVKLRSFRPSHGTAAAGQRGHAVRQAAGI